MSIERFLRQVHSWLGALILPWVVIAGLTGIFMNHRSMVLDLLPKGGMDLTVLDSAPLITQDAAVRVLAQHWGKMDLSNPGKTQVHGRPVYQFEAADETAEETAQVDLQTGYYWIKTRFQDRFFDPQGRRIGRMVHWSKLLLKLHQNGWAGRSLGSWPADICAGALVVFGCSGIYLFIAPRLRRAKNRRARRSVSG